MTVADPTTDTDLAASDVTWDIDTILHGRTVDELFDDAEQIAARLAELRGRVGRLDAGELADAMHATADLLDLVARASYHPMLAFSTDTSDPARGAAVAHAQERSTSFSL